DSGPFQVPLAWVRLNGFSDRVRVVVVARRLREQEHVFVRLRGPVGDALGHGVGFRPDDVGAQIPAIRLEGEGDAPGEADQVLGLERRHHQSVPLREHWLPDLATVPGISALGPTVPVVGVVCVPEVKPERPTAAQNPPHLAEDLDHVLDVQLGRRLQPELAEPGAAAHTEPTTVVQAGGALVRTESARCRLFARENVFTPPPFLLAPLVVAVRVPAPHGPGNTVVPEAPIRRRGDNAMDRFIRERAQHLPAIADEKTILRQSSPPRAPATRTARGGPPARAELPRLQARWRGREGRSAA